MKLQEILQFIKDYGLFLATLMLVVITGLLVHSNYKLINFQKELLAPNLKIWQVKPPATFYNFDLVQESGWKAHIELCFRNDGRATTGPINVNSNIRPTWNSSESYFDTGHAYFSNINPGEGDCTTIGISHQWTNRGDPGNKSLVPTGYFKIPINVTCLFCDEYMRTLFLEVCVKPTDKC